MNAAEKETVMTDLSEAKTLAAYRAQQKLRFVTAASLFDGHDAAINIMRRILISMGAEVIHLGHNRSVDDIVTASDHNTGLSVTAKVTKRIIKISDGIMTTSCEVGQSVVKETISGR